jgi:hypothetical protein
MAFAINFSRDRLLRLVILLSVAIILGLLLQTYFGLSGLAAYSLSVTLTVQTSNAINKLSPSTDAAEERKISKAEARALGKNPKKKKL